MKKVRAAGSALRRNVGWVVLLVLPWLLALGVREWRGQLENQVAPILWGEDETISIATLSPLEARRVELGTQWERERSTLLFKLFDLEAHANAAEYRKVVKEWPNEVWPKARLLSALVEQRHRTPVHPWAVQEPRINALVSRVGPNHPSVEDLESEMASVKPPSPAERAEVAALVQAGRRREPDNAFYDTAWATHLMMAGQIPAGLAALERASRCRYFDSHALDAWGASIRYQDQVLNLPVVQRRKLWSFEPNTSYDYYLVTHVGREALCAKRAGRHPDALRLLRNGTRLGCLMMQGPAFPTERWRGGSFLQVLWRNLGGWGSYQAFNSHLSIRKLNRSYEQSVREASRAAAQYVRLQRDVPLAQEVEAATAQFEAFPKLPRTFSSQEYVNKIQQPCQGYALAQVVVGTSVCWIFLLLRMGLPPVKLGGRNIAFPILVAVLCGITCFAAANFRTLAPPIKQFLNTVSILLPCAILLAWWPIVGCLRGRRTLSSNDRPVMNAGEDLLIWRVFTGIVRWSPIMLALLFSVLYRVALDFEWMLPSPFTIGYVHFAHWAKVFSYPAMSFSGIAIPYSLYNFGKWRWFSGPNIVAEVNRSLYGLGLSTLLLVAVGSLGYLATNLAFIPVKNQLENECRLFTEKRVPYILW